MYTKIEYVKIHTYFTKKLLLLLLHPFNVLFSRTTWISRHQKGKPFLDFTAARDDVVAVASSGPYANHLHLAPYR